jgi:hypothetical protein
MPAQIHITIVRTGKAPQVVSVVAGNSVASTFNDAGFAREQFAGWSVKDQSNGRTLGLEDVLSDSTTLIVGQEVAGA